MTSPRQLPVAPEMTKLKTVARCALFPQIRPADAPLGPSSSGLRPSPRPLDRGLPGVDAGSSGVKPTRGVVRRAPTVNGGNCQVHRGVAHRRLRLDTLQRGSAWLRRRPRYWQRRPRRCRGPLESTRAPVEGSQAGADGGWRNSQASAGACRLATRGRDPADPGAYQSRLRAHPSRMRRVHSWPG